MINKNILKIRKDLDKLDNSLLKINKLDDYNSHSLKADYYKKYLKEKSNKLLDKIKKLKQYGKKNSFKS